MSSPNACLKCSRLPTIRRAKGTTMNAALIIDASYFLAAFLFIFGLKRMSSPVTARSGIVVAGWGMVIAVAASFLYTLDVEPSARPHLNTNITLAVIALVLGLGWAWGSGKTVAMTARSEERRGRKVCVRTGKSRVEPSHLKKK